MAFTGKKSRKDVKETTWGKFSTSRQIPIQGRPEGVLWGNRPGNRFGRRNERHSCRFKKTETYWTCAGGLWLSMAMVRMQDEELLEMQIWPYQYYDRMGATMLVSYPRPSQGTAPPYCGLKQQ